ncbi:MAG: hypothetical protein RRB13_14015 [bacterium]|nr:hypothetical protein [bacterium]
MALVKKLQTGPLPDLLPLFSALAKDRPFARIRGGDLLFRLFEAWPEALEPYAAQVLGPLADYSEIRCRWAFAKIAPFLVSEPKGAQRVFSQLEANLSDNSQVLVFTSLQGMYQLGRVHPPLKQTLAPILFRASLGASPSVRGTAKQLLARLGLA